VPHRRRARLASCQAAAGVRSIMGAISSNGSANMSCSTNASRSAGVSVSNTTSSASPTESASSAWCVQVRPLILEAFGQPGLLIHRVTFLLRGGHRSRPANRAGEIRGPFIDVDDIADGVLAALTREGHAGQLYEVTGPRLLTFADAVAEMGRAAGRTIEYRQIPRDTFVEALVADSVPSEYVWLLDYLFGTVLDGRNEFVADGVRRALGRDPRDFRDFARDPAASGVWSPGPAPVAG
jgi:hypothetical protein